MLLCSRFPRVTWSRLQRRQPTQIGAHILIATFWLFFMLAQISVWDMNGKEALGIWLSLRFLLFPVP